MAMRQHSTDDDERQRVRTKLDSPATHRPTATKICIGDYIWHTYQSAKSYLYGIRGFYSARARFHTSVCLLVYLLIFTTRSYASAVYAVVVCPSVCLSVSESRMVKFYTQVADIIP